MSITLGIDPGYGLVGYGVIKKDGGEEQLLGSGVIRTEQSANFEHRLLDIYESMTKLIAMYAPELLIIEQLFFGANATTCIKVAGARGVILLAAAQAGMQVEDIGPTAVKSRLCGNGKASKGDVQLAVMQRLGLPKRITPDDANDAVAMALVG